MTSTFDMPFPLTPLKRPFTTLYFMFLNTPSKKLSTLSNRALTPLVIAPIVLMVLLVPFARCRILPVARVIVLAVPLLTIVLFMTCVMSPLAASPLYAIQFVVSFIVVARTVPLVFTRACRGRSVVSFKAPLAILTIRLAFCVVPLLHPNNES